MIFSPKVAALYDIIAVVSALIMMHALVVGPVEPGKVRSLRIKIFSLFVVLTVYAIIIIQINDSPLNWLAYRFIRASIHFLGSYALARLYYVKYQDQMGRKLMEHLYWIISIHAVILLAMVAFNPIRSFVFNVLQTTSERMLSSYRVAGLAGSFDVASCIQGFGVIIFPLVMLNFKGMKSIIGSISLVLIICSVLLSGRTGMLMLLLLSPVTFLVSGKKMMGTMVKLGFASIVFMVLISVVVPQLNIGHKIAPSIERLQVMFMSSDEGGGTELSSSRKLIYEWTEMWPEDTGLFLFGNSTDCRVDWFYVRVDPGYLRDIYGVGLTGLLIIIMFYMICIRQGIRCLRFNRDLGLVSILFAVQTLIIHAKVHYLLARNSFTISCILLVATAYAQNISFEYDEYEYQPSEEALQEQTEYAYY